MTKAEIRKKSEARMSKTQPLAVNFVLRNSCFRRHSTFVIVIASHSPLRPRTARPPPHPRLHPDRPLTHDRSLTLAPAQPDPSRHQTVQRDLREWCGEARRHRTGHRSGRHALDRGHGRLPSTGRTRHAAGGHLQPGQAALRNQHRPGPPPLPGTSRRPALLARPARGRRVQRNPP